MDSILDKILKAEIFIADVSTVCKNEEGERVRYLPNPNVLFELGYARAILGEERIILFTSTDIDQLPFDIRPNRTTAINEKRIDDEMRNAILAIDRTKPPFAWEERERPSAARRLELSIVSKYVRHLPNYVLGRMFELLPSLFNPSTINSIQEEFRALLGNPQDRPAGRIKDNLDSFYNSLYDLSTEIDTNYHYNYKSGMMQPQPRSEARSRVDSLKNELHSSYCKLIEVLRTDYPELDFIKLAREAAQNYPIP